MKPAFISLPPYLATRISADTATRIFGVGNAALLSELLFGFIASRQCSGHILIETLDLVPQWVEQGRVLVSGFHSPLEQQVFKSYLRRKGRAVKVLARNLDSNHNYRPATEEWDPIQEGRLLILSAMPSNVKRTTRESALARNRLVLALSTEVHTSGSSSPSSTA